jgi:16S rRNA (guanine966-N2)-methyltransferase
MDRVKGAIFSSLAEKVIGARVLDLFAGSGGLGIEALSRGAATVLFVDNDRQAIDAIQQNLAKAKLQGATRQQDVFQLLQRSESLGEFDLVFADPPYEAMQSGERFTDKLLSNRQLRDLVAADGFFVLEKRPEEKLPEMPSWNLIRQKAYGATEVLILARNPRAENNASPARTDPQ